uniref:Uncharacterized protein n=1 Tax=Oryza rufipogon TaxID=4529 RepID=A0A0E0PSG3_ORYRU
MVMQTSAQQWAAERVGNEVLEPRGWMRVVGGRERKEVGPGCLAGAVDAFRPIGKGRACGGAVGQ